ETFSVNDYVGERTEAKGFVGGGAIQDGEFVEEVGGGVSQFATTTYNAAFFGGYEIPVHQAHSYYISRYPEGREATLNYPTVDLQITNNSPYGFLIDTSYTDTSITVTLWGKKWVDVSTTKSGRTNFTTGETIYRENDDLPEGSEQVIQSPGRGWDVTVTRTLDYLDGGTETEEIFTRYQPQLGIIERNRPGKSED
ncbi:MAG: VanW family protein, partial [Egibacteraceae bacterium]